MTDMTTPQMIGYARAWLATQIRSTPREILQSLHDMAVSLLGPDNPPNPPTSIGENTIGTAELLAAANKFLDGAGGLSPHEFLVEIKNQSLAVLQQLPKWRCSMFFPKAGGGGIESSLAYAHPTADAAFRKMVCDGVRSRGGDTLLFIADMAYGRPDILTAVDASLEYAVRVGITHLIVDVRNDNNDIPFSKLESWIKYLAEHYRWANSEQIAFMTCLETSEIMSVEQTQQAVRWCKQYAPLKRVIVGAQNLSFLKAIGNGAELWYEIHTDPFKLSQSDADRYIADLKTLLPYGHVWAGEFWDGSSELSKQISRRALEIGCQGIGSWVQ